MPLIVMLLLYNTGFSLGRACRCRARRKPVTWVLISWYLSGTADLLRRDAPAPTPQERLSLLMRGTMIGGVISALCWRSCGLLQAARGGCPTSSCCYDRARGDVQRSQRARRVPDPARSLIVLQRVLERARAEAVRGGDPVRPADGRGAAHLLARRLGPVGVHGRAADGADLRHHALARASACASC